MQNYNFIKKMTDGYIRDEFRFVINKIKKGKIYIH